MREIGGYFGMETFPGDVYHKGLLALNSGRNALAWLLRARGIRKLNIPYFLCDSVSGVCERENCAVAYYHIDSSFLPRFDRELEDGEWLYVVNYYGQIADEQVLQMVSRRKRIIFDNVQDFFRQPLPGVDTIYSCRKFFGVPDGAYLATDAPPIPLEQDASKDRMKHILGRFEGDCASDYYSDFKENDRAFRELPVQTMSRLTDNLLRALDYDTIRRKRNANWAQLHDALGAYNKLELTSPDGPYMYPFYCENGMKLKKQLAAEKIYIPTLWPNVLDLDGCRMEKDYAQNILPLPVDQRYDGQDMARISTLLLQMLQNQKGKQDD